MKIKKTTAFTGISQRRNTFRFRKGSNCRFHKRLVFLACPVFLLILAEARNSMSKRFSSLNFHFSCRISSIVTFTGFSLLLLACQQNQAGSGSETSAVDAQKEAALEAEKRNLDQQLAAGGYLEVSRNEAISKFEEARQKLAISDKFLAESYGCVNRLANENVRAAWDCTVPAGSFFKNTASNELEKREFGFRSENLRQADERIERAQKRLLVIEEQLRKGKETRNGGGGAKTPPEKDGKKEKTDPKAPCTESKEGCYVIYDRGTRKIKEYISGPYNGVFHEITSSGAVVNVTVEFNPGLAKTPEKNRITKKVGNVTETLIKKKLADGRDAWLVIERKFWNEADDTYKIENWGSDENGLQTLQSFGYYDSAMRPMVKKTLEQPGGLESVIMNDDFARESPTVRALRAGVGIGFSK